MALQYDTPVTSTEFAAALATNTNISDSTAAAINSVLGLDSSASLVVAGWNGVGAVNAPVGQVIDVLSINVAGTAPVDLTLPAGTENAPVIIIDSEADVTLTIGDDAAASARVAGDVAVAAVADVDGIARVVVGGNGDDTITYNGTENVLVAGGAGNDTITTDSGDDVIVTGEGNDVIDAGTGYDTIEVTANFADFTKSVSADGEALVLTGVNGSAGNSVTVTGGEIVTFAGGETLTIVESQEEAQALSLYQALLGRDADKDGAANFINAVDGGASLEAVVGDFLNSNEYQTIERTDFLSDLYTGLFGRETDDTGLNGWLSVFEQGASRSDVIAGIAGSAEASALSNDSFVSALYEAALGRDTVGAETNGWISLLESGASRTDVANDIFASAEANTKTNTEFVDSLFETVGGDAATKAGYLLALESGASHSDVVVSVIGQADLNADATHVIVVPGAV